MSDSGKYNTSNLLKIAIPNKGSLSEQAIQLLKDAGYRVRKDSRQLVVEDASNGVQFFYLRPHDIATYVGSGTLDLGITGFDLLLDSHSEATALMNLGFGPSTFRLAAPGGSPIKNVSDLEGKRIATSYSGLLEDYLASKNIRPSKIVHLEGAVESSIDLGVADAIADVVSTGTTLKQAGLVIFGDPILESQAVLIKSPHLSADYPEISEELNILLKRFEGVLTARENVLIDYDIAASNLDAAIAITPGFAGPTISELGKQPITHAESHQTDGELDEGEKWFAVRSLIPAKDINKTMDELSKVGAKAILTTAILASRM
jgi:ATP phosphoribosyltransferase